MRHLLRGRPGDSGDLRLSRTGLPRPVSRLALALGLAALVCWTPGSDTALAEGAKLHPAGPDAPVVRITSPLGRTGTPTALRIVAQIRPAGKPVTTVRFFVDGSLLNTVTSGPPYSADWTDANPFDRREIVVEADDEAGRTGRDRVVLEPYELNEVTEVTSVLVDAAVYDKTGRPVRGMTAPEFILEEDGKLQTPDMVAQETLPTLFALVVDTSQSMWRNMEFVQETAARLAAYLRPKDTVIVAPFTKGLRPITGPTNDRQTIADAIASMRASGGTAMRDSLVEIAPKFVGAPGRRVIILITDAYDEHSTATIEQAVQAAKETGATIYTIGIGGVAGISMRGNDELKAIAAATGGRAFFPPRPEELARVYDVLASDAQTRYLITYTPSNQRRYGTWRSISLRAFNEEYRVKARDGYFAPKPPPVRPSLEFTAMDLQSGYLQVTRDDLVVLEDGVEQKLETFHELTTPVSLVLALDSSGSMKKSSEKVTEAALTFVSALRPEDFLGIITFADKTSVAHGLTTNRQTSFETIAAYQADGGTALYDALGDSVLMLKQVRGRRALVVLTDGRDENNPGTAPGSKRTWDQALSLVREVDVLVFPVGLGTKIDPERLNALASASGGQAYFPEDVSELAEQFRRVSENLSHRYSVSYTSTNPRRDGGWRRVEIRSKLAGVVINSREGYFAPEK